MEYNAFISKNEIPTYFVAKTLITVGLILIIYKVDKISH